MSLNKVILIGNLGRDPEVRYMPNTEAVCTFSIATNESWHDKQTGQKVDRTEWHNITLYRRLAEVAGQYLKKGSQVYIEGRIQSEKYIGKDGIERTNYKIIGNEMKMLGSRNEQNSSHVPYTNHDYNTPAPAAYTPPPPAPSAPPPSPPVQQPRAPITPTAPVEDIDDDIPF